jgi:3-oxoacyl-[acyl-carrier protein] reductase
VVHYLSHREEAEVLSGEVRAAGGRALALRADVTRREEVRELVRRAGGELGPVDILVNKARQLAPGKRFMELEWSDYQLQLDVMVKGALNCCQAVLPSMVERRTGRIINILSAVIAERDWRGHVYGAVKTALLAFSQNLAAGMGAYGITVNMVSPGFTPTERQPLRADGYLQDCVRRTPLGRLGRAGGGADFITGVNLPVCGGRFMF